MASEETKTNRKKAMMMRCGGGGGGIWFLGFVGALVYFLHFHSGSFWLVVMAFVKALFWPAYLVYYLLLHLNL